MSTLKRFGEMAGFILAISAVVVGVITFFGGRIPPWATYAWAENVAQQIQQTDRAVNQLSLIILARMAAESRQRAKDNPNDLQAQTDAILWDQKLQKAIQEDQTSQVKQETH